MNEKRNHRLSIKLTNAELEIIQNKAKVLKMDTSAFVRLLALNAQIKISLA